MSARGQDPRDETLDEQLQEQGSTEQVAENGPGRESAHNRSQRQPGGHQSHEEPSFAASRARGGETMVEERGHSVENVQIVYRGSEGRQTAFVNEVVAAAPQHLQEHPTLTDANPDEPQSPSTASGYTLAPAAANNWRASSPRIVPVAAHEANPEREVQWPPALTAAALPPRPTPPWRGALAWRAQRPWPAFEHPMQAPQEDAGVVRTAAATATVGLANDSAVMLATDWDRTTIDDVFAERLVQTLEELFNWRQREASDSEESLEDVPAAGLNVFAWRDVAGPGDDTPAVTQHHWSSLLDILPSDTQACGSMMDSQGIPWGSDTSIRAAHHRQRIREYPNYTNVPDSLLARECDVSDTKRMQSCLLGGYGRDRCGRSQRAAYDLRRWLQSGAPCAPPHSLVECSSKRQSKRGQVSHRHHNATSWGYGAPMLPSYSVLECTRRVRPTVVHFQLRHLLRATSEDDVYLVQSNCLLRYCPSTHQVQCLLNLSGQTIYWSSGRMLGFATNALSRAFRERPPAWRSASRIGRLRAGRMHGDEAATELQMHERVNADTVPAPETVAEHGVSSDTTEYQAETSEVVYRKPPYRNDGLRVQMSTMSSDGWLCVAGGFAGEIIAVDCRTGSVQFDWRVAGNAENAITNYIELFYRAEASDPGSLRPSAADGHRQQ
ncbi:hypothetical protein F1559_004244 [Cyanidiococcus yangmingshanensis]|uniref:Uncharacterized protein n=1 Tax=Cyanidiococcus yangmingshanensis TaxID=2690220 RepID=A0A7J7IG43_9RHOD|nr:hypothetical protein F1559_004244 [Cyanidiococcus yangmingshanensis]